LSLVGKLWPDGLVAGERRLVAGGRSRQAESNIMRCAVHRSRHTTHAKPCLTMRARPRVWPVSKLYLWRQRDTGGFGADIRSGAQLAVARRGLANGQRTVLAPTADQQPRDRRGVRLPI